MSLTPEQKHQADIARARKWLGRHGEVQALRGLFGLKPETALHRDRQGNQQQLINRIKDKKGLFIAQGITSLFVGQGLIRPVHKPGKNRGKEVRSYTLTRKSLDLLRKAGHPEIGHGEAAGVEGAGQE